MICWFWHRWGRWECIHHETWTRHPKNVTWEYVGYRRTCQRCRKVQEGAGEENMNAVDFIGYGAGTLLFIIAFALFVGIVLGVIMYLRGEL